MMGTTWILARVAGPPALMLLWFITMVGGWEDVGRAAVNSLGHQSEDLLAHKTVLKGAVLAASDELAIPTHVTVADGTLLLIDRYRAEQVLALDRYSGRVLDSFGRKGEGPGEFKGPVSLVVDDAEHVGVLDAGLNRITWLSSPTVSNSRQFKLIGTTEIAAPSVVTDFTLTPSGQFLGIGFLQEGRLVRLNREGQPIGYAGDSPRLEGLPVARQAELYQGSVRSSPNRTRHVLVRRFASEIQILDERTLRMITVWGPKRFAPSAGRYESRFGYLDSAPMKNGFLALYSGRTRPEYPGRANYGSTVHAFGWDGRLTASYELGADIISIALSESDQLLYAIRHDPRPAILVYDLKH